MDKEEILKMLLEINEERDSIEIGKAGQRCKIYCNLNKPEDIKKKIDNFYLVLAYAEGKNGGE